MLPFSCPSSAAHGATVNSLAWLARPAVGSCDFWLGYAVQGQRIVSGVRGWDLIR